VQRRAEFGTVSLRSTEERSMAQRRRTSLTIRLTLAERQPLLDWQRLPNISAGLAHRGRIVLRSPSLTWLPWSASLGALSTNGYGSFWRRAYWGWPINPALVARVGHGRQPWPGKYAPALPADHGPLSLHVACWPPGGCHHHTPCLWRCASHSRLAQGSHGVSTPIAPLALAHLYNRAPLQAPGGV
jgi:hypothetical protein